MNVQSPCAGTATPYNIRTERTVGSVSAHAVTLVWQKVGHAAWCTKLTEHGVIEASAQCTQRHPSMVTNYIVTAVLWTHDEWATITKLTDELGRVTS